MINPLQNFTVRKMKFPNLNIKLSKQLKLAKWSIFSITSAYQNIDSVDLWSQRAGWNQTTEDLQGMVAIEGVSNLRAIVNIDGVDIPLGSGIVLPAGQQISWIGMILVHPEVRRQGIARAIMKRCVREARLQQEATIVGLDATPLGSTVYHALGFKEAYKIWRCAIGCSEQPRFSADMDLESIEKNALSQYLTNRDFPNKHSMFKHLQHLPMHQNIMAISEGQPVGFVMSRPGRLKPYIGPLIADSSQIAAVLLRAALHHWRAQGYEQAFVDVPAYHLSQASIYKELPIVRSRELTRMYQLISKKEKAAFLFKLAQGDPIKKKDWSGILNKVVDSHKATLSYIETERRNVVSYKYAIAGPELG